MVACGTQHIVALTRDGSDAPFPKLDITTFVKTDVPAEPSAHDEAVEMDDQSNAAEEKQVIEPKSSSLPSPLKSTSPLKSQKQLTQ